MLNPSLSKVQIGFSQEFFPECLTKKYNDYLFHLNHPLKTIDAVLIESIQNLNVPGFVVPSLNVQNLPNLGPNFIDNDSGFFPHSTMNRNFEGHEPWFNAIENSVVSITFRNNIMNWCYLYEMLYNRYQRRNRVEQFSFWLTLLDAAEIPAIRMKFSDCWVESTPALEFSFNQGFGESKTFDAGFKFNKFDMEFVIPEFQKLDLKI